MIKKTDITFTQNGDLIFFNTHRRRNFNQVGMAADVTVDEITLIHASLQKRVIISSTKKSYYAKDFRQINSVTELLSDRFKRYYLGFKNNNYINFR